MPNPIPGTLWRVLHHYPKSDQAHRRGQADTLFLMAHPSPSWSDANMDSWNRDNTLSADSLIVVGETVDTHQGSWVRILLPKTGWINRVHFNPDSSWLQQVSLPTNI